MVSHNKLCGDALCADLFVTAHLQAATHPKTQLLHRDISSGNLLILPRFDRGSEDMVPSIAYTGILTDWEMSKPIYDHHAKSLTSQAVRMVCIRRLSPSC